MAQKGRLSRPRYPSGPRFRRLRHVFEYIWIVIIVPVVYSGCKTLAGDIANHITITPTTVVYAFFLAGLIWLWQHNISLASSIVIAIVLLILTSLLAWADSRREKRWRQHDQQGREAERQRRDAQRLAGYYVLKPVSRVNPDADLRMARYIPSVYLPRHDSRTGAIADAEARAILTAAHDAPPAAASPASVSANSGHGPTAGALPLGILVVGRPTLGKTRFAWEALRSTVGDALFIKWPHESNAPALDFTAYADHVVVLWLDDLAEYASDLQRAAVNELPQRFARSSLVIVATCRDADDLRAVNVELASLVQRLHIITLADLTPAETDTLITELSATGTAIDEQARDGTPGALLLDVKAMTTRFATALTDDARSILRAIKVLRSAQVYTYPAGRTAAVARELFTLAAGRGTWDAAVGALVTNGFVRLGVVGADGLHALEPHAGIYLERCVDYDPPGSYSHHRWPALQELLTREQDADALFALGNAYAAFRFSLSQQRHAEACFRQVLALVPADTGTWADTQNNLGVVLRAQAECGAEGKRDVKQAVEPAERRRLLAEAEAASRAALQASAEGTGTWAMAQNNLGTILGAQAELVAESVERARLLAEAEAVLRAALGVSTRGTHAWAYRQTNLGLVLSAQAKLATEPAERWRLIGESTKAHASANAVHNALDQQAGDMSEWSMTLAPTWDDAANGASI